MKALTIYSRACILWCEVTGVYTSFGGLGLKGGGREESIAKSMTIKIFPFIYLSHVEKISFSFKTSFLRVVF